MSKKTIEQTRKHIEASRKAIESMIAETSSEYTLSLLAQALYDIKQVQETITTIQGN